MNQDDSDQRWRRLKSLVADASLMEADDREIFLGKECADDPGLRQEVEALLTQPVEKASFLDQPGVPRLETEGLETGSFVGPFRVLRPLGSGGMGDVYLAERADGTYELQVAIKVIRLQQAPSELRERFISERRLMAELQHPNIAALHDAGTLDDGRPYFVMEYIDGEALDIHCRSYGLSVRDRVRLVSQIADAVACAHRALVVHRDVKPANVLVDRGGVPKLLDFGIAKDLSDLGKTPSTRLLTPMTPEYASPEQMTGRSVGTAADVYALGVVLYELLTGFNPFGSQDDPFAGRSKASPPTRPSRCSRVGHGTPDFRSELRGDLDELILKALAPDPAERYPSAEALHRDLEHFLEDQPLDIRSGSFYRVRKWIGRNRWAVAFLITIAIALIGWGAARIDARQEEMKREVVTEHSRKLSDYLIQVLDAGKPSKSGERSPAYERVVLRAAALLDENAFRETPRVRAALLSAVGTTFRDLGRPEDALPRLEESLEIRRSVLSEEHPEITKSINNLANCYRALNRLEEARLLMLDSISILERSRQRANDSRGIELSRDLATHWNNLAGVERELGNYSRSIELYEDALGLKKELFTEGSLTIVKAHNNLVAALLAAGRLDAAEDHLVVASELLEGLRGDGLGRLRPTESSILHHRGILMRERGHLLAAEEFFEKAWIQRKEVYGDGHRKTQESLKNWELVSRQGQ